MEALTEETLVLLGFAQINHPLLVRFWATFPPRQGQRKSSKTQFFCVTVHWLCNKLIVKQVSKTIWAMGE